MQNTHKKYNEVIWIDRQEAFIKVLKRQPLIVVVRPEHDVFENNVSHDNFIKSIGSLIKDGIINIEIGWLPNEGWVNLIQSLRKTFPEVNFGAASITTIQALDQVIMLKMQYAMSPVWNLKIQEKAKQHNQILIPGVFSPSEIQQAIDFKHRIVKLFPASVLGINYLSQIKGSINSLPFIIAAGGLKAQDLNTWISKGYGGIILGRELKKDKTSSFLLKNWLSNYQKEL